MDAVGEGQLLPIGSYDIANYLGDFASSHKHLGPELLDVHVEPLYSNIYETGEAISLKISLASADEMFFTTVSGNYIIYFHNPQILTRAPLIEAIQDILLKYPSLDMFLFEGKSGEIIPIGKGGHGFTAAVPRLIQGGKVYENSLAMQRVLTAMDAYKERGHFMWISDSDLVLRSNDRTLFGFVVELLGGNGTTFSYLGHGEVPHWPNMNSNIVRQNGNSWYAKSEQDLLSHLDKDISYFAKPGIEQVQIDITWSPLVETLSRWYPQSIYGSITNFRPMVTQDRPSSQHLLGGMNYSENKRFIHYLNIPSLMTMHSTIDGRAALEKAATLSSDDSLNSFTVARVYVSYKTQVSPVRRYSQQDITLTYQNSQYLNHNPRAHGNEVLLDTLIQNTPLVLLESATMVNSSRNYLGALQLLQAQYNAINRYSFLRPEEALQQDLETLKSYYDLVYSQAQAVNLLQ